MWVKTLKPTKNYDTFHSGIMVFCAINLALGICLCGGVCGTGALVLGMVWAGLGFLVAESLPE